MLRRLLSVVISLLAALFVALAVPLASNIAQRETQVTYLDRLADAERYASLADETLSHGDAPRLAAQLRRYSSLYGISVAIVAPDGRTLLSSGPDIRLDAAQVRRGLRTAFAGYRVNRIDAVLPWEPDPLVVVVPVGRDSGVTAAVVVSSPTTELRTSILWWWGLLAAGAVVMFLLALAVMIPLSRWVLRPVRDLDDASAALAAGRLDARVPALAGPPELRRFASSFNTMAEVVTRTLRRQRTFVSDASHQLRNPLAGLRLAVENLEPYVGAEGRDAHADALAEAEELDRIVDSLLTLTRIEGTGSAAEPQPLDDVIAAHRQRWRSTLEAADMTLHVDVPERLATYAPAGALGQILDELVDNAARLSGGTHVTIDASTDIEQVVLRINDDGEGLSTEEVRRAGERFWRGRAHQNIPGTGMGLAICREVAASWGGSLELHTLTPHGLQARITLPAARQPDTS